MLMTAAIGSSAVVCTVWYVEVTLLDHPRRACLLFPCATSDTDWSN